jgi:hypothetical protein
MGILAIRVDERVKHVSFTEESISVDLMDGRTITVPMSDRLRVYPSCQVLDRVLT